MSLKSKVFISICLLLTVSIFIYSAQVPITHSSTVKITISNPYKNYANWYKGNLHSHTENSDGENTADEMMAAYRASGYGVNAIADHNCITNSEAFTDLPFFLGINAEEDGPSNVHIVALDITTPINENQSISKRVADIIGQGGIADVAHPGLTWSLDDVRQAVEAGARLMEIEGDAVSGSRARGYWDNLLSENKLVYGTMSDDAHSTLDIGIWGWVMVNAESLSKSSILQSLEEGNFYCVQSSPPEPGVGPEIYSITVENENVIVISAAGDYVTFIGDYGTLLDNKVLIGGKASYSPTVGLSYVRMEVHNEGGVSYTQPLMVEELPGPSLISPENNAELLDNTPTFEWTSVSTPGGVTYQIQIDDDVDFSSPVYFAVGLVENTHTLPDENALSLGMYFWRVRAVDNAGNVGLWSSVQTLLICTKSRWTQTDWKGGPTKPSLQVENWDNTYDNFYDNENVNWSGGVRLEDYLVPISGIANHLVISEFATRGYGGFADEFVELYNPTSNPISIAGWDLQYFSSGSGWIGVIATFPDGATIPAYGFYLIANSAGYSPPGSGPPADYSTTFSTSLADGSTTSPRGIRLRDASDAVIDTVVYGGDGNYACADAEGGRTALGAPVSPQSVERKAQSTSTAASMAVGGVDENSGNGYDSNNNYNDWVRQNSRNPENSSSPQEYPMTSRFRSAGWLESSVYDAGGVADWKFMSRSENKPSGTSIIVKARTGGDDNPYDGSWSDWYLHNNGAENTLMENERYIQYRVELSTTDNTKTPELLKIALYYEGVDNVTAINWKLENLYAVTIDLNGYFDEGENLVAKFYTYGGGKYQDQTVVCSENIPGHVTLLENVSRPGNGAIQRVELVVVDNENNVLQTIKIFETSRTTLMGRLSEIDLIWPFASLEERTQLMAELSDIDLIWPFAPLVFEDP